MAKVFTGKVVSTSMQKTVVVEVTRLQPHPLYKKLLKRSKNYKVDPADHQVTVGQRVKIGETKQISKDKYFKILEILAKTHTQKEEKN
jgi:small subunit ribosomal protein S17